MLTILWLGALQAASVAPDPVVELRRAVERSLPWIEEQRVATVGLSHYRI